MPQSLAKVLVHLVFSTKKRSLLLPHDRLEPLVKYAYGIFEEQKCHLIETNNVADHVHILFDLHRTVTISDVVMHRDVVMRYIQSQQDRHARLSFQDEFRELLRLYEIEYDERYVWD